VGIHFRNDLIKYYLCLENDIIHFLFHLSRDKKEASGILNAAAKVDVGI